MIIPCFNACIAVIKMFPVRIIRANYANFELTHVPGTSNNAYDVLILFTPSTELNISLSGQYLSRCVREICLYLPAYANLSDKTKFRKDNINRRFV